MTNFDLFTKEQDFVPFAETAIAAEVLLGTGQGASTEAPVQDEVSNGPRTAEPHATVDDAHLGVRYPPGNSPRYADERIELELVSRDDETRVYHR